MTILIAGGRALLLGARLLTLAASAVTVPGGAATLVTLNDVPVNQQFYQRDSNGGFDLSLSGTSNGTTPVQARAVDAFTGAVVVDWTTLGVPVDSTYAGKLRCPGRIPPMLVQVRDSGNPDVKALGTKRFFVGANWLWMGQSLAVNMPETPYKYPLGGKGSIQLIGDTFQRIGSINDNYPPNTRTGSGVGWTGGSAPRESGDSASGDGYVCFANILSEKLGCAVCLTTSATGGKDIDFWVSPSTGNVGWARALATIQKLGGDVEGAAWYQGQADAAAGRTKASYKSKLGFLQSMLHGATGRDASNFKLGLVSLGSTSADGGYTASMDQIRAAIVEFAYESPGAFLAASDHDCQTGSDAVHENGISYAHLGPVLALSVAAQYGIGPSGAGPRVVSAVRAGVVVDFKVQHAGGTQLVDGAGGTGTALTGFRFFLASDATKSSPLAISASSITGPDTFRLVLAADPGAPIVADYGMIPAPHAPDLVNARLTPNFASAIYDNVALVHQVRGCILQPFAAMAVTGS